MFFIGDIEMSESTSPERGRIIGRRLITNFVIAQFCLIAGNLMLRILSRGSLLPTWAIAILAVATALPMIFFAFQFSRRLRTDLDEMLQRIVLEGLSFAMVVFVPLAGLYVNGRAAGFFSLKLDPPELLLMPSILVAIGILISWSRHK